MEVEVDCEILIGGVVGDIRDGYGDGYGDDDIGAEICSILGRPLDAPRRRAHRTACGGAVPLAPLPPCMFSTDDPTYLPAAPRVVVIGDVHGDIARLARALVGVGVINTNWEWVAQPRDTVVVQMGDQVDGASRVPSDRAADWERVADVDVAVFMDRLDAIARVHGGRALSLIGNHELMNLIGDYTYVSARSLARAGGPEGRAAQFHPAGAMGQILAKRNVVLKIGPLLFAHGGVLPQHLDACGDALHLINEAYHRFARREPLSLADQCLLNATVIGSDGIAWTRDYLTAHGREVVPEVLARTRSAAVFIGHNTVDEITCEVSGRLWFTDAMFSRAYGSDAFQVLNVTRVGDDADATYQVQTVRLRDPAERAVAATMALA